MKISGIRKISYRGYTAAGEPVPCLPLQGKHLEDHGFFLGSLVEVNYQREKIVVTLTTTEGGENRYGKQELLLPESDFVSHQARGRWPTIGALNHDQHPGQFHGGVLSAVP